MSKLFSLCPQKGHTSCVWTKAIPDCFIATIMRKYGLVWQPFSVKYSKEHFKQTYPIFTEKCTRREINPAKYIVIYIINLGRLEENEVMIGWISVTHLEHLTRRWCKSCRTMSLAWHVVIMNLLVILTISSTRQGRSIRSNLLPLLGSAMNWVSFLNHSSE